MSDVAGQAGLGSERHGSPGHGASRHGYAGEASEAPAVGRSADRRGGLALAQAELERNPPPPLTLEKHGLVLRALGECLDELDRQREAEAADSAA
jgi:hypothetical protein